MRVNVCFQPLADGLCCHVIIRRDPRKYISHERHYLPYYYNIEK